jgi:hypothetical protein
MNWTVDGLNCNPEIFNGFEIEKVLVEYDGPRLFTAGTPLCTALFMLVDENETSMRFVVAPTDARILSQLEQGLLTVRGALDQPLVWVVQTNHDYRPENVWRTSLDALPEHVLPPHGMMLWPHLQPAFSLRAIGEGLTIGGVPSSVVRQVVEGASTALRKAAFHIFHEPSKQGRIKNTIKRLYDLPVQYVAYNSFEIAFRLPQQDASSIASDEERSDMNQIGAVLANAMNKFIGVTSEDNTLETMDIELLEAVAKLAPQLSGGVTEFEVGGSLLGNNMRPFRLNRDVSKKVKSVLQKVRAKEEKISTYQGLVAEMDRDNFTFTLRQTSDGKDHVCSFLPEFFDDVLNAFVDSCRVAISGRETLKNGNIDVSIFSRVADDAEHAK